MQNHMKSNSQNHLKNNTQNHMKSNSQNHMKSNTQNHMTRFIRGLVLTAAIAAACFFIIIIIFNQPAYVLAMVYALIALNIIYIYRAPILIRMGDAHLLSGSFEKAGAYYKRARKFNKKSAAACNSYGAWLSNANMPDDALAALEAGLSLRPTPELEKNIIVALIGVYLAKNDIENARLRHEQIKSKLDGDINKRLDKLLAAENN